MKDRLIDMDYLKLFEFLNETGGDLFRTPFGTWQYTTEKEGREGRSYFVHGKGETAQGAIMDHPSYESDTT